MKNWKFIQVGNAESMIEKEIKIIYEANGKDREKAKEYISKKYPSIARTGQLDRILDEVAGVPARSKNESIDKQEWSMFQGLKKDAEKEIGNKAIVLKDGNVWVVLYANETKSQEFESEAEAREFAKKVGNADTVSEYNSEIQRLTKKAEELRRMGQGRQAMEIEKQIEKLGKELHELGNKKVRNYQYAISVTNPFRDARIYGEALAKEDYVRMKYTGTDELKRIWERSTTGEDYERAAFKDFKEAYHKKYMELDRTGNKKTGNETKAEEKFGKVMGEYEEGALKTPQGKTVTDPAQAKAIAYSEADKVDNLKRARNAMNKKK